MLTGPDVAPLLRHVAPEEVAAPEDLLGAAELEQYLADLDEPPFTLIAVGDIMLGGRARRRVRLRGPDYPFAAVLPLLRRTSIVVGNLEGPLARRAEREKRNFSYRVRPDSTGPLVRAGVNVLTLANNHLVDCGRHGVLETIEAVEAAGICRIGAGRGIRDAHRPAILQASGLRIGLLGYYWNRRCAATDTLPGSAMDTPECLAADIRNLRWQADRVVVTFHWGIPYEREPLPEDRSKARLAIDLGADVAIGHHPHVIQPFEIYRDKPIFYSVGNFTFGSGNSRGEGLLLGLRFEPDHTFVAVHPLYVKNRDPRVDYQPKVLRGQGARRCLDRLARASARDGERLSLDGARATLWLPYAAASSPDEAAS
jgi:hypothetical protein